MKSENTRALVAAACLAAVIAPGALAQNQQLEEIVVTAERREARLQDVPISVTAVNMEQMEARQVVDVVTLAKIVPGLAAKPTLSPLEISIAIRGVTQLIPSVNVDPAIGSYVDGVYSVINAGSNNAMIDMERVEVLKGPQGTLFGRNTIGGAISVTTARPTEEFGGYLDVALGNYGAQTYTGVVNGAMVPGLMNGRLVYQHTEQDGYGKNRLVGGRTNTVNQDYVRGSLSISPSDDWELIGSAFYTESAGNSPANRLSYFDPEVSLAPGFLPPLVDFLPAVNGNPGDSLLNYVDRGGFYDSWAGLKSTYQLKQYGATGTLTAELGEAVTFKSITGYTQTDYNTVSDLDGTPYVVLELIDYPIDSEQFSQEIQFYGDAFDSRLSWITGAYYFATEGSQLSTPQVLVPIVPGHTVKGPEPADNISMSVFAQLGYDLTPQWRATVGARIVRDEREVTYRDHIATGGVGGPYVACSLANAPFDPDPANCVFSDDVKYDYVPWTAGLDYRPDDNSLLYGKIAKGYRSGAFGLTGPEAIPVGNGVTPEQAAEANAFALSSFEPVDPERLISYELGGKFELLDRRLRINAAAYWSDYDNIQITTNRAAACDACARAFLENSGKAEIYGGELEVTALLGELLLEAGIGYTEPKYKKGPYVGEDLINISKVNYALAASYPINFDSGLLTLGANYSYRSKATFYTLSPGLPEEARDGLTQDGFGLIDARVTFDFANAPISVSVFGQNLADEEYIVSAQSFGAPISYVSAFSGVPRTYGVSLRYNY